MSRAVPLLAAVLLLPACVVGERAAPTDDELPLLAYLQRDPYVVIDGYDRDADGHLIVLTRQGNVAKRYLLAPDDPASPALRLRRMDDECRLETAPNPQPGGGPVPRGR